MNHDRAFQLNNGRWQYATLNKRGGGPICGCHGAEGHDTAEEAERHYYDTSLANLTLRTSTTPGEARPCHECGTWTDSAVSMPFHGPFDKDSIPCCPTHMPDTDDEARALATKVSPFRAGMESYHS